MREWLWKDSRQRRSQMPLFPHLASTLVSLLLMDDFVFLPSRLGHCSVRLPRFSGVRLSSNSQLWTRNPVSHGQHLDRSFTPLLPRTCDSAPCAGRLCCATVAHTIRGLQMAPKSFERAFKLKVSLCGCSGPGCSKREECRVYKYLRGRLKRKAPCSLCPMTSRLSFGGSWWLEIILENTDKPRILTTEFGGQMLVI